MRLIEIFCDSDGVAADWKATMLSQISSQGTGIVKIDQLNKHPERPAIIKKAYREVPNMFAILPMIPSFLPVLKCLKKHYNNNVNRAFLGYEVRVRILTAVGEEHHDFIQVRNDKERWFESRQIPFKVECVHKSEHKTNFSNGIDTSFKSHHKILIDDFLRNCNNWNAACKNNLSIHVADNEESSYSEYDGHLVAKKIDHIINSIVKGDFDE